MVNHKTEMEVETTNKQAKPLAGSCHCGAVKITLTTEPSWLVECNCSVCWRYGARWAHGTRETVTVEAANDALRYYSWGDRGIEFYFCQHCGCLTHYESTEKTASSRVSLNTRMSAPDAVAGLRLRHFDGADSWEFLD